VQENSNNAAYIENRTRALQLDGQRVQAWPVLARDLATALPIAKAPNHAHATRLRHSDTLMGQSGPSDRDLQNRGKCSTDRTCVNGGAAGDDLSPDPLAVGRPSAGRRSGLNPHASLASKDIAKDDDATRLSEEHLNMDAD